MSRTFFARPILNSPYREPGRHWRLDAGGLPTDEIVASRRVAEFVSPVPAPRAKQGRRQLRLALGEKDLSTEEQQYNPYPVINRLRDEVGRWRRLPEARWGVTPETARLLRHWRHHDFQEYRPFWCQVEAVETAIWLVEVAGALRETDAGLPARRRALRSHLREANAAANPHLFRLALKMATGAGKTAVMAMLIAWQTVNAVRHPARRAFTRGFLVVTPGITIRDRLRVLRPGDPDSYYRRRELVPRDLLPDLDRAEVVITNFHAFRRRERSKLSRGTRSLLRGRGRAPETVETEGEMLRRVLPSLMGMKRVLVLNDEGHHCYREKVGETEEGKLVGDDREEAKKNTEAARLWITGIETVRRRIAVPAVFDLSATPFFLRGSGYAEGTLFPWTVSDFSLMDAIEAGIVKLPRVPIAEDVSPDDLPRLRNLWEHIGKKMPKKGRRKTAGALDPHLLPPLLETALDALHTHYRKTLEAWREAGIETPPVLIVVCNNTATSKLLHDYIAGFERERADGTKEVRNGRLESFRNYDEHGARRPRPRTLLIDSEQIESGEALDKNFREAAKEQIERFRREIVERTGNRKKAEEMVADEGALLREAMNTVGKSGRLGEDIRCVVSVQMLTEGWDANTVTHILGVRAFGTQLLCEQVVGRALRRQSYAMNPDGARDPDGETLLDPEYADVLGVPFDFTAKPVVGTVEPPRPTVAVHAVSPERDDLEIRFPRVEGYREELPEDHLTARFGEDSGLVLTPELVGPAKIENQGIVGLPVELRPDRNRGIRSATLAFHLAHDLLRRHLRGADEEPRLHLFGQTRRLVREWLDRHFECRGTTHPGQLLYEEIAEKACERIHRAITLSCGDRRVLAVLDPYNPEGSTAEVNLRTSKQKRMLWKTAAAKSPVNWAVCDSSWEQKFCRLAEAHPRVEAYVKNSGLGFEVPYRFAGESRRYLPDFIVRVRDGAGNAVHLVVEIKGLRDEEDAAKADTMRSRWIPGVNNLDRFGRWEFLELRDLRRMKKEFHACVDAVAPASAAA